MFSPDGTLISASSAPHCGGSRRRIEEKGENEVDDGNDTNSTHENNDLDNDKKKEEKEKTATTTYHIFLRVFYHKIFCRLTLWYSPPPPQNYRVLFSIAKKKGEEGEEGGGGSKEARYIVLVLLPCSFENTFQYARFSSAESERKTTEWLALNARWN